MKLWRKVGIGFKSNILILISVAVWHKVTQSADALAHLISFIYELTDLNITRYTRETESDKRISKPNLESELNCQNRDYLPLGILLRVLMTTMENSPTKFTIEAQRGQKPLNSNNQ